MCPATESNTASKSLFSHRQWTELLIVIIVGVLVFVISARADLLERLLEYSLRHESWEVDELLVMSAYFAVALLIYSIRRWRDVTASARAVAERNRELQTALTEVNQLRGIIPICASCKKVRDDQGFWHQVEVYVRDHSEAEFSHGYCPDCASKLYEELDSDYPGSSST
jgi:hypothetical protein